MDALKAACGEARLSLDEKLLVRIKLAPRISRRRCRAKLSVDGETLVDDVGGSLSQQDLNGWGNKNQSRT